MSNKFYVKECWTIRLSLTVEHVLRDHMCQGGGYCSVNTEMEVRDLVIFGKAPGESRGTGPSDCLTVLRDHVSSTPEL